MAIAATYAPGQGTLIGMDARWVLVSAELSQRTLDDIWRLLQRPGSVVEDVVLRIEKDFPVELPSMVVADLTPGGAESATRGEGRLSTDGSERTLSLGAMADPRLPLIGGVVSACAVSLVHTAAANSGAAALSGAPLIAGVPEHILAARASSPPSRPAVRPTPVPVADHFAPQVATPPREVVPAPTEEPRDTGDHDGHTMMRVLSGEFETAAGENDEAVEHTVFRHEDGETVLAMRCGLGHPTPAFAVSCRVCHQPVGQQEPVRIPRPQLGVLRLPSGEMVPVDRGIVFGRRPAAVPGGERWPHLVHLPTESTYLSRMHLQIELDGWLVLARDLGSQGGTRLHVPGREPELIRPHEPYVLEHGWVLDLADVYAVTFEVTQETMQ
ncbi:MAG: hypothetical protein V9G04_02690 [Nocardioides sp.]|jgi:hypothetical protein